MRLNGSRAIVDPADLPVLSGMLQAKLDAAGISLRDAVLMPVTPDGLFVLAGCLATPGNESLLGNTWMPGVKDMPLGRGVKHVVFLAGRIASSDAARAAKHFLTSFSKQLKLNKVLKGLTFHVAAFFTSVGTAVIADGVRQVTAIKCPAIDQVDFFGAATGEPASIEAAASALSWETTFTLLEEHEAVLGKLKTELWS